MVADQRRLRERGWARERAAGGLGRIHALLRACRDAASRAVHEQLAPEFGGDCAARASARERFVRQPRECGRGQGGGGAHASAAEGGGTEDREECIDTGEGHVEVAEWEGSGESGVPSCPGSEGVPWNEWQRQAYERTCVTKWPSQWPSARVNGPCG